MKNDLIVFAYSDDCQDYNNIIPFCNMLKELGVYFKNVNYYDIALRNYAITENAGHCPAMRIPGLKAARIETIDELLTNGGVYHTKLNLSIYQIYNKVVNDLYLDKRTENYDNILLILYTNQFGYNPNTSNLKNEILECGRLKVLPKDKVEMHWIFNEVSTTDLQKLSVLGFKSIEEIDKNFDNVLSSIITKIDLFRNRSKKGGDKRGRQENRKSSES